MQLKILWSIHVMEYWIISAIEVIFILTKDMRSNEVPVYSMSIQNYKLLIPQH